jgi:hypothetical protein
VKESSRDEYKCIIMCASALLFVQKKRDQKARSKRKQKMTKMAVKRKGKLRFRSILGKHDRASLYVMRLIGNKPYAQFLRKIKLGGRRHKERSEFIAILAIVVADIVKIVNEIHNTIKKWDTYIDDITKLPTTVPTTPAKNPDLEGSLLSAGQPAESATNKGKSGSGKSGYGCWSIIVKRNKEHIEHIEK